MANYEDTAGKLRAIFDVLPEPRLLRAAHDLYGAKLEQSIREYSGKDESAAKRAGSFLKAVISCGSQDVVDVLVRFEVPYEALSLMAVPTDFATYQTFKAGIKTLSAGEASWEAAVESVKAALGVAKQLALKKVGVAGAASALPAAQSQGNPTIGPDVGSDPGQQVEAGVESASKPKEDPPVANDGDELESDSLSDYDAMVVSAPEPAHDDASSEAGASPIWKESHHLYGSKAAICFDAKVTKSDGLAVGIAGALRQTSGHYDWGSKINILFTKAEIATLLAVLHGHGTVAAGKNHGKNRDKGFEVKTQQDGFLLQVFAANKTITVPMSNADALWVRLLLVRAICLGTGVSEATLMTNIQLLGAST